MWVGRRVGVLVVILALLVGACGSGGDDEPADAAGSGDPASAAGGDDEPSPGDDRSAAGDGEGQAGDAAVRYLAIGDSLTQGVGAPDEATGAFPILLAERWREDGCEVDVQNVGVSGSTAGQMIEEQVPAIDEVDPTVVTFQSGANDIVNGIDVDQYRSDVATVLDAIVESGAQPVVLFQNEWFRAPAAGDYGDVEQFEQQRDDYDDVLLEEAEARGAQVVDLRDVNAETADEGLWVDDGIHPTPEVYERWAEEIADAVPCG